ncbi:hypothetical protein CEXT_646341 [Caerostris extrusa]|uniref:Uncharacterized protein n=1 Tax=Caerostris extrusa TaxID=172846 RepID=A0AAV4M9S5_CAEEX|nr:hypothetical protein CEXT_646341 [Caerostris extrusa]
MASTPYLYRDVDGSGRRIALPVAKCRTEVVGESHMFVPWPSVPDAKEVRPFRWMSEFREFNCQHTRSFQNFLVLI